MNTSLFQQTILTVSR